MDHPSLPPLTVTINLLPWLFWVAAVIAQAFGVVMLWLFRLDRRVAVLAARQAERERESLSNWRETG